MSSESASLWWDPHRGPLVSPRAINLSYASSPLSRGNFSMSFVLSFSCVGLTSELFSSKSLPSWNKAWSGNRTFTQWSSRVFIRVIIFYFSPRIKKRAQRWHSLIKTVPFHQLFLFNHSCPYLLLFHLRHKAQLKSNLGCFFLSSPHCSSLFSLLKE